MQVSFELEAIEGAQQPICPSDGQFIAWCGLLVNKTTIELQADYSRYVGNELYIRDSFSLEGTVAVGTTLRKRLFSFLRPKCHAILLDARINSIAVVRLNIYQAFLLAAIKLHCYTRALPEVNLK